MVHLQSTRSFEYDRKWCLVAEMSEVNRKQKMGLETNKSLESKHWIPIKFRETVGPCWIFQSLIQKSRVTEWFKLLKLWSSKPSDLKLIVYEILWRDVSNRGYREWKGAQKLLPNSLHKCHFCSFTFIYDSSVAVSELLFRKLWLRHRNLPTQPFRLQAFVPLQYTMKTMIDMWE